jgi:DNA-binding transcriptional ArsR family regulator
MLGFTSGHDPLDFVMNDTLQPKLCAQKLRFLGDADRLRIIRCLSDGPMNVTEIADALDVSIAKASHHLKVLRHAEAVIDEKQGRFVIYRLNPSFYEPAASEDEVEHLNLGCCRLEIPKT